jgi:hypothetical protein
LGIFDIFLDFLKRFLGNFSEGFFWRNFFGGIFWEKFFRRIFLGGIFWEDYSEDFLGGIGIDLFVKILVFVKKFRSLEVRRQAHRT